MALAPRPLWLSTLLLLVGACYEPYSTAPSGPFLAASHDNYFPITSGAHDGADCNSCHGAFDTFTRFSCITCHEHAQATIDPVHTGVAGYAYSETSCYDCHPTGEGMDRASHFRFPIVSGNHGSVTCQQCHPQGHQSVACFDCHSHTCAATAPRHDEVRSFSCDSMRCYECHPRGVAGDD